MLSKLIYLGAAVIMSVNVCLGGDGDKATNEDAWWNKQFVISSFTSVTDGDDIKKVIALFAEAGLNATESNTPLEYRAKTLSPENVVRALKACEKHNIKFFITDHNRMTGVKEPNEENLKALVAEYSKYPALGGYYVWDEPRGQFDAVKKMYDVLQQADPSRLPLVAMLPSYWGGFRQTPLEKFCRDFIETVNPPVLSFDYYGVRGSPGKYGVDEGLYRDMELWSALSLETGKPFWFYGTSCNFKSAASKETLRFQVYTAIAYGAKGIQYFVVKGFQKFGGAPVNEDGTKGPIFEDFKAVNHELKAIGPTLMTLKLSKLMHTRPVPEHCHEFTPHLGFKSATDDLVVSFHTSTDGKDYLLVVNKDLNKDRKVEFEVDANISLLQFPDKTEIKAADGKLMFELDKGAGKLFKVQKR